MIICVFSVRRISLARTCGSAWKTRPLYSSTSFLKSMNWVRFYLALGHTGATDGISGRRTPYDLKEKGRSVH
jgi:hypothetical protein